VTIRENVALAGYTTFGIGGPARWFVEASDEADVVEAVRWAGEVGVKLYVLGGGSNLLVPDEGFEGLVLLMNIRGVEQEGCSFNVGAGEVWDELVTRAVSEGCAGVECLAGIPGSVGGTPVQNVGAYGQEVAETIVSVRAFDRQAREFVERSNAECGFRYRESIFNTTERGRYIVTRARFGLRAGGAPTLKYQDLQKRFGDGSQTPTLGEVAAAVREIRRVKGMLIVEGDPDSRSAGSFFKNPVVGVEELERVKAAAGLLEVPHWAVGDRSEGRVKLPAAWLVERAGFAKGYGDGPVGISSRHTLALVNRGGGTFADVRRMQEEVVAAVEGKFGVRLEREPVVLG
jgi:UDP-N-acetylmuramate dehydrogenase